MKPAKLMDTSGTWRWMLDHLSLIVITAMVLAIGIEWYLTSQVSQEIEARMTIDLPVGVSMRVQDVEIEALRDRTAAESLDPAETAIAAECGDDYPQLLKTPSANGTYLKHDIMELRVAERGTVCLTEGEMIRIGDVRLIASEIGKSVVDPASSGQRTAEQIEVYRYLPRRDIYLSVFLGAMTILVGSILGLWFDHQTRKHDADRYFGRRPPDA